MSLISVISQYKSSSVQELEHMLYNSGNERENEREEKRGREGEREFNKGRQKGWQTILFTEQFLLKKIEGRYDVEIHHFPDTSCSDKLCLSEQPGL